MRLIDADKLKEYLQEYLHYEHAIPWIDAQPTVFNVEKVVKELKEWTFNADVNIGDGTIMNHDLIAGKIALDIVKRGGISAE